MQRGMHAVNRTNWPGSLNQILGIGQGTLHNVTRHSGCWISQRCRPGNVLEFHTDESNANAQS